MPNEVFISNVRQATEEEKQNAPFKVSGFIPSPKSHKDWVYAAKIDMQSSDIPSKTDNPMPEFTYDQGRKGSCTGNAGGIHKSLQEYESHGKKWLIFSRDFLYTLARQLDGLPDNVEGSTGLAIMKVLQKYGVCLESTLPYTDDPNAKVVIPAEAFTEAALYKIQNYAKLQDIDEIKHALALGKSAMVGLVVTDTFMYPDKGFIGVPYGKIYGGHEITLINYDDEMTHTYPDGKTEKGFFIFKNSWGQMWGDQAKGYLSYDFFAYKNIDLGSFFLEGWTSIDLDSDPVPSPTPTPEPTPTEQITIELWIGNTEAKVNGKIVNIDQPPVIMNSRTMLPTRFVAEALNCDVTWDGPEKKVTIRK